MYYNKGLVRRYTLALIESSKVPLTKYLNHGPHSKLCCSSTLGLGVITLILEKV
jgi:hypothetical protein